MNKKLYLVVSSILISVAAFAVVNITNTNSLATNGVRDCDSNAIIRCGALSQSELLNKFNANATGDLPQVFARYGISKSDMAGATSEVKMGKVYRDGRVEVGGKIVATNATTVGRQNIAGSRPVDIAGRTYYERPTSVSFRSDIDAFVLMRNGQFYRAVLTSCANPIVAKPVPQPPVPQPKYTCDSLKNTKITRNEYKFTTDASASGGATITGYKYDFGDGKSATSTSPNVTHVYEKPGNYTVKVSVQVAVNGGKQTVTGANCRTVVVVAEKPLAPIYRCDSLTAKVISLIDRKYEYSLAYTAQNGATLNTVVYDFGDNEKVTLNGSDTQTVVHTFKTAGSYKTVATLNFKVNENNQAATKSISCEVSISTSPEVSVSTKPEACLLNPSLPKDSPNCVAPPAPSPPPPAPASVAPQELPQTGIGEVLSGSLGLGSLTAAGYYWRDSRRNLQRR